MPTPSSRSDHLTERPFSELKLAGVTNVDSSDPEASRDIASDDTVTVSIESMAKLNSEVEALKNKLAAAERRAKEADTLRNSLSLATFNNRAKDRFFALQIGGWNPSAPANTPLMFTQLDPRGRTVLYVPVFLNDLPLQGKPFTAREFVDGKETGKTFRRHNYDLGRTTIKESTISFLVQTPSGQPREVTLSGMAIINMSLKSSEEIYSRLEREESPGALNDSNDSHPSSGITQETRV